MSDAEWKTLLAKRNTALSNIKTREPLKDWQIVHYQSYIRLLEDREKARPVLFWATNPDDFIRPQDIELFLEERRLILLNGWKEMLEEYVRTTKEAVQSGT